MRSGNSGMVAEAAIAGKRGSGAIQPSGRRRMRNDAAEQRKLNNNSGIEASAGDKCGGSELE